MRKGIGLLLCVSIVLSGCNSSGDANGQVEQQASEIVSAFSNNDINEINQLMGFENKEDNTELTENEGALTDIFSKTELVLENVGESTISYRVSAPDMSDVFEGNLEQLSEMSETELSDYIKQYVQDAEVVEGTVTLEYTMKDDEFIVDYTSQEFVNAITGGLLQAYVDLYEQMLEGYEELIKESN